VTRVCSIFSQILQLIPRLEFESAVCQHHAETAEPGSEGKYVCHHCVEVRLEGELIAVGLESFPTL
jgi:hypothetical protein